MKQLVNPDGSLSDEGLVLVQNVLNNMIPIFKEYMSRGYSVFEILGVLTSSLINAQKQAWLDEQQEK